MGQGDPGRQHQGRVIRSTPVQYSVTSVELSRCRGIGDRCKVGRTAGMITVRRDAVRAGTKGGADQRSSSRLDVFDHAEVVKCDIYATANTLKSQDTPNLLSPTTFVP